MNTDDEPISKLMSVLEKIVLLQKLEGSGADIFTSTQLCGNPVSRKAMARKRAEALYKKNNKNEKRKREEEEEMELVSDLREIIYTECPRRNVKYFGRVFLMLNYTDITQNTYI